MGLDMNSDRVICSKCGQAFGKRTGHFQASYAALHKGVRFLPICKDCVDSLFSGYLSTCKNPELAVRQMCRKLDLYWNKKIYDAVEKKNSQRTIITAYITRVNTTNFAGKCYDDTLLEEGTLWSIDTAQKSNVNPSPVSMPDLQEGDKSNIEISETTINAWGTGYSPEMYLELDKRYSYWLSEMNLEDDSSLDIGTKMLIRQICSLELDINRDRADGKPVDKSVTVLNNLLGSLNWKPVQKKQDDADNALASTPLGVWLYRYENERPLPEIEDNLKENRIRKYVFTWMGHLCKMLGAKNAFSKLYEDEVARLRVEAPEYDEGESDEAFMNELFDNVPSDESPSPSIDDGDES